MGVVARGEVYWVNLDPTIGTEIKKTRPALVVSPDDLNAALPRVIIAPLTSPDLAPHFCWTREQYFANLSPCRLQAAIFPKTSLSEFVHG